MVERNMSNAVMRGIVVPPKVEGHITRTRIASEPGISRFNISRVSQTRPC